MTGTTKSKISSVVLDDLLLLQIKFMAVLGIDPSSGTIATYGYPSKDELGAAIGITVESAEILEGMNKANRVWKNKGVSASDHIKEELIDVIFFTLELAVLLNLSGEDLAMLYIQKYKKNLLRILSATASKSSGIDTRLVTLMDELFGEAKTEELIHDALIKSEG